MSEPNALQKQIIRIMRGAHGPEWFALSEVEKADLIIALVRDGGADGCWHCGDNLPHGRTCQCRNDE